MIEGPENLTSIELAEACKERGLPAYKLPREKLLRQIKEWVNYSVTEEIPASILLLSSALYTKYNDLPIACKLPEILNKIPDELVILLKTSV